MAAAILSAIRFPREFCLQKEEALALVRASARNGRDHYVYALCRCDGTPFYIGKGKGDRLRDHEKEAAKSETEWKNSFKCRVIRKTLRSGESILYTVLFVSDDNATVCDVERDFIAQIGRRDMGCGPLTNMTDGGEGGTMNGSSLENLLNSTWRNPEWSQKQRDRIAAISQTDEWREAHQIAIDKVTQTDDWKRAHAAGVKRLWENEEFRRKHAERMRAFVNREDIRASATEALRRTVQTEEYKAMAKARGEKLSLHPTRGKQISESLSALYEDDEFKAKAIDRLRRVTKTEEWKQAHDSAMKAISQTEEWRIKHDEAIKAVTQTEEWRHSFLSAVQSDDYKKNMSLVVSARYAATAPLRSECKNLLTKYRLSYRLPGNGAGIDKWQAALDELRAIVAALEQEKQAA